jgi:hypothetical protein
MTRCPSGAGRRSSATASRPEDWDVIRAAEPTRFRGVDYVDWHRIAEADPRSPTRWSTRCCAKPARRCSKPTPKASRWCASGPARHLLGRDVANIFQFKSFPLALVMDQARRVAEINERKGPAAAAPTASFVAGMTLLGALSLQLKEIIKGKDMRDPSSKEFWFDAFVQGGGAGVIGDFVGSFKNDRVDGLAQYLGGPVVSFAGDAGKTVKSAFEKDKETGERGRRFGYQASRFARRYTPGTTIWYLRAALDRMLWDELQERIDPDFADHQQRLEDAARRQGQEYWWRPGETGPERAPAMGQAPQQ